MSRSISHYIVNPGPKSAATGLRAAVSTDSAIVTETMVNVLKAGGNAADAGIAGALVQAAVEPFMTNHAGLITLLYYEAATGVIHQLEGQGSFPSGLPPFKPVPPSVGSYAAFPPSGIVPGFMPSLKELHTRFSSLSWEPLCADAVAWAERGHPVSTYEYGVNVVSEKFLTYFPEGRSFYQPNGFFTSVGEVFVPNGLAKTLQGVAKQGPDYMISGPWAETFVAKANEMGWMISLKDMRDSPPRWVSPLRIAHHDHDIVSLGPPQTQGFFIAVTLGILKHLGVREMRPGSAESIYAMGQALRHAARHWEFVQDDRVFEVPVDEVLDDAYHAHLARLIARSRPKVDLSEHIRLAGDLTSASDFLSAMASGYGRPRAAGTRAKQPSGSCEIAVVDAAGNWLQMMNTLQGSGIPGMVIDGVPMVGSHATFGELSSPIDATLIKGAHVRCVMGNTMVLKGGKPILSLGTPGNVHCTVPQVLTQALDFGLPPYEAVDAPRMLPMTEARGITIEDRLQPGVLEELHKLGVRLSVAPGYDSHMGAFSLIAREEASGTYTAVADPRRCGVADGLKV